MPKYGARPSTPDQRNYKFPHYSESLPPVVSLMDKAPPTINQGALGACVSNSLANVVRYRLKQDSVQGEDFLPSRLAIYYDGRVIENTVDSDSGLSVADGCKVINAYGVCAEHEWPYDISKFTEEPPAKARIDATHRKAVKYMAVSQNINAIKSAIQAGYPVTIGFSVYESFESDEVAKTGTVPMPDPTENMLGGHCVTIFSMDSTTQLAHLQNSWGTGWAVGGFFTLPFAYLLDLNLTWELWAIELMKRVA